MDKDMGLGAMKSLCSNVLLGPLFINLVAVGQRNAMTVNQKLVQIECYLCLGLCGLFG